LKVLCLVQIELQLLNAGVAADAVESAKVKNSWESLPCEARSQCGTRHTHFEDIVDHRPIVMYSTWNGDFSDGEIRGRSKEWRDWDHSRAVSNLLEDMSEDYRLGYRRGILTLPAGTFKGMPTASAQWLSLDFIRWKVLKQMLPAWLAEHPDFRFGLYVGWHLAVLPGNPSPLASACSLNTTGHRRPNTSSSLDLCIMETNVRGWTELGATEFWYGASSADPDFDNWVREPSLGWDEMRWSQKTTNWLKIGGEAIPVKGHHPTVELDDERVHNNNYVSTYKYLTSTNYDRWKPLNEDTTEIMVMLTGETPMYGYPSLSLDVVYELHSRGFALMPQRWSKNFQNLEWVKRVCSIGPIECPADFNADGTVNSDDLVLYDSRWKEYSYQEHNENGGTLSFYNGDMNGDSLVDSEDKRLFHKVYYPESSDGVCKPLHEHDLTPACTLRRKVARLIMTTTQVPHGTGSRELQVNSLEKMQVHDRLIIGDNEVVEAVGFDRGSLMIWPGLASSYPAGASVKVLAHVDASGEKPWCSGLDATLFRKTVASAIVRCQQFYWGAALLDRNSLVDLDQMRTAARTSGPPILAALAFAATFLVLIRRYSAPGVHAAPAINARSLTLSGYEEYKPIIQEI